VLRTVERVPPHSQPTAKNLLRQRRNFAKSINLWRLAATWHDRSHGAA
jgi:hypothetical protein